MLDRIAGLFRRGSSTDSKPAAPAPATRPSPAPEATAAQAEQAAAAARALDASPTTATALPIARGDFPAELRCRAVGLVDDAAALRAIALEDKVARVRLAAASRLSAAADLEVLRRESTDKAVQRHARDALKLLRDEEQRAQETRARIEHLLAGITHHAARGFEPLYDAKLDALETAWREVAALASAADQERFAEQAALARDTVQRHAAEIAARERAISARQELIAACAELEATVARLGREDLVDTLASVAAVRSIQQTRWEEAAGDTGVDAPLARRYDAAIAALDRWLAAATELPHVAQDAAGLFTALAENGEPDGEQLDDWQDRLDNLRARVEWPDGLVRPPLLAELEQAHRQLRTLRKARQQDREQQLAHLRKRRHALKRMVDEGQLRAATRTHHWLQKRIAELPAKDADMERAALAPVAEALARLHDWYAFASVPKKTELCERMEALAGPAPDIAARSEAVRELRGQWATLCAADPDADPALRARFEQAAETAFAPCAAWYAAQHRIQDENLAKRVALCERLATEVASLDPAATDWRALEKRERDARAEWKTCEPVRWPEARATQERFSALIGELRGRLDGERRRNAERKGALVSRATALATHEPLEAAIAEARQLQEDWKRVGFTDPRDDRALWQPFRAAIDNVFARRDAARDAERAGRDAAAAEAAARRQEEDARRREREQARQAARQAEVEAALALADAEARTLAGQAIDMVDLAAVQSAVDAVPARSTLGSALRARAQRLAGGQPPAADTLDAEAAKLADLTLDIEIQHELPSPPAFAAARMQRKIARLNASLRGARDDGDAQRALVDAWLATGPVRGEQRAPLLARVRPALQAAG